MSLNPEKLCGAFLFLRIKCPTWKKHIATESGYCSKECITQVYNGSLNILFGNVASNFGDIFSFSTQDNILQIYRFCRMTLARTQKI